MALGAVDAQPAAKLHRIGWLFSITPPSGWRAFPATQALVDGLRQFGYEEGRNLGFEVRSAEGKAERLPDLAVELVSLRPDVLVVSICGPALNALRKATSTIPIVVLACQDDMVATGVVASLAHPGGNVTGISKASPEWGAKKLQLLKETIPAVSRVAVLWVPTYTDWSADWEQIRMAARMLGVTLESIAQRGGRRTSTGRSERSLRRTRTRFYPSRISRRTFKRAGWESSRPGIASRGCRRIGR